MALTDFTGPDYIDQWTSDLDRPRRFPVEMHSRLLLARGFVDCQCVMQLGKMACIAAVRP